MAIRDTITNIGTTHNDDKWETTVTWKNDNMT